MNQATTITDLATKLQTRELSAVEIAEASFTQIKSVNSTWKVFTQILEERALLAAAASDKRRLDNQSLGVLDGVPVTIKDNLHLHGMATYAGTQHDFSGRFDKSAMVVQHLEAMGAVILGKCAMDEAALGATTNNPHTGQCYNPACPGTTPGGSSGGSAAAVAAHFVPASLGTDTMGSVRIPAAYCHLWGFKPGQGVVSQQGLVPLCAELDCIGPLAHNAKDLQLMMLAITGNTMLKTMNKLPDDTLRIGVAGDRVLSTCDVEITSSFEHFVNRIAQNGVRLKVENFDLWNPGQLRRDGLLITEVRAQAALEIELREHADKFSATFHKLMDYGRMATQERLETAIGRHHMIKQYILNLFNHYDYLLLPTAPQLAFPFTDQTPDNQADFTALANVVGCPAVAFPVSIPSESRMASMQMLAPPGSDLTLITAAQHLNKAIKTN